MSTKTETKKNEVIIEGVVVSARYGKTKFSEDEKNRLTIKSDNLPYEVFDEAYKSVGSKLTPTWLKERNGYINLNSKFDIPNKSINGRKQSFNDFIEEDTCVGSEVKIALTVKEGAIYPIAFVVTKEGEPRNAFDGLE